MSRLLDVLPAQIQWWSRNQGFNVKSTAYNAALHELEMRCKRKTENRLVKVVCVCAYVLDGWVHAGLQQRYFYSSIVFVPREENPVRTSFVCRNETAASLRHPPTHSATGIPSYRCADESHSPETGFPRRLPCPLYCLLPSSERSLQRYENKPFNRRNWRTLKAKSLLRKRGAEIMQKRKGDSK